MNRDALVAVIESALPVINMPGGTENLDFLLYDATNEPAKSDSRLVKLISLLSVEPELELFNGYMQVVANSASRVDYSTLAGWLLRRARGVGSQEAVSDLERYVVSDQVPCTYCFAIAGIKLPTSCSLGSGIELLPWDSIPELSKKHPIFKRFMKWSPVRSPTAILLRPVIVQKLHVREVDPKVLAFNLPYEELQDALLCCSLIGPFAPHLLASWLELPDWAPVDSWGYSSPFPEGLPRSGEWPNGGCERARLLISAFKALPQSRKVRLRLAMERLNTAMSRMSQVDAAIDLGIVFEILFLHDLTTERQELTFRLRLRAARYLEADPQKRRRIFDLLNDLYKIRSSAVHSGRLQGNIKGIPVQDLLNQGFGIAAAALERLIFNEDPDWHQVTLG